MRVSAKVDYALRAMAELAAAPPGLAGSAAGKAAGTQRSAWTTAEQLASAQHIPPKFLESILSQLRSAGLVASQRGAEGGYQLARPAEEISIADVIRELEGPIATVRGVRPDELEYDGAAAGLRGVWLELRTHMRDVLEQTTLADLAAAQRKT
jgi:Rrf2 family protein